ncbi:MAG: choice-of-anchor B family protein [Chitinophagales bacterium]|nr:choice-of-anchor B family protein [Chitinophagales bacterium]
MPTYRLFVLLCGFVLSTIAIFAQTNMSLIGHLPIADQVSSLWGYAADGREYALVGTEGGTIIVDITDPAAPDPLQYINGFPSPLWREIKIWQHYAYIVSESGGNVQILDLSDLPGLVTTHTWTGGTWQGNTLTVGKAHTLWIDENGILYLNGTDLDAVVMADLNTDPLNPSIVGLYTGGYVHDLYARNDTVWAAEIYNGHFTVLDVSDKANPIVLATQTTPSNFTHNTWLSDNGQYLFTTDEKTAAYITAYDISDLSDIRETDRYRSSPNSGVIPHNTHVLGNFLVNSYYRDGVTIVDATDPYNLVEVGNYDTSPLSGDGFNGVWEVYPYLPSGNLIAGDMEEGLFILHADYIQACYLNGTVSDAVTGQNLAGVSVSIEGFDTYTTQSKFDGTYSTGIPTSGTYEVSYYLYGYEISTVSVNFSNGITSLSNVALVPITPFNAQIFITNTTGQPLADASVRLYNDVYSYDATTNSEGAAILSLYYGGTYTAAAGKWAYRTKQTETIISPTGDNTTQLTLKNGYYDDFMFDFGWTNTAAITEPQGTFVRQIPIGRTYLGDTVQTYYDVPNDYGAVCYLTGNANLLTDNVSGTKTLSSPLFDATLYADPMVSYYRWTFFQNNNGLGIASNDTLLIQLNNGIQTVTLDTIINGQQEITWRRHKHRIANFLTPTNQMTLSASVSDASASPHVVEVAFDYMKVVENTPPIANFSANQTTGCGTTLVELSDLSEGDVEIWQWTVTAPNGSTFELSGDNPTLLLDQAGMYGISLVVFGISGFDVETKTNYITIYPQPDPIILGDWATAACLNDTVWLTWNAQPNTTYTWSGDYIIDSGDGFLSINAPAGQHSYSIIATNANGCTTDTTALVTTNALPDTPTIVVGGNACIGEVLTLSADEPQDDYTYTWVIADSSYTAPSVSLALSAAGILPYALQVSNPNACAIALADTLYIGTMPLVNTDIVLPNLLCPDSLYAIQLSIAGGIPPYSYEWESNYAEINSFDANSGILLASVNTESIDSGAVVLYALTPVDANGCTGMQVLGSASVSNCTVGINTIAAPLPVLRLSPNPTNSVLQVELTAVTEDIRLQITDALGRIAWAQDIQTTTAMPWQTNIELGQWATGWYTLNAISPRTIVQRAFWVNR